ncbi:hypothetical protein HID58_058962, partial [Brassica napus]
MNYNSLCYVQGNGSPLWASIYRFPRHADGSGLGFGAKKGSACTVLHTAALLFSLDPWLSQLYDRRPLFPGDGGSVSTVIAGSCSRKAVTHLILKVSKLFRLLISHLKRLVNVGGVGSMVDGSHESTQIVFDVCLVLSVWDTVHFEGDVGAAAFVRAVAELRFGFIVCSLMGLGPEL